MKAEETRTKFEEWRQVAAPQTQTNSFNDRLMWLAWQAALASSDGESQSCVHAVSLYEHCDECSFASEGKNIRAIPESVRDGERERLRTALAAAHRAIRRIRQLATTSPRSSWRRNAYELNLMEILAAAID